MKRTGLIVLASVAGAALAAPVSAQPLNEDFDCYEAGAPASNLPGWELWPGGAEAIVTGEQAFSGMHSLHLNSVNTDVVRRTPFRGVPVTFSVMTYIPSSSMGLEAYVMALVGYDGGGAGTFWGSQVKFDATLGEIDVEFGSGRAPLMFDRWVECRAEIDLATSSYDLYYGGTLLAQGVGWWCGITGQCTETLAAISFYIHKLDSGPGMYIDDVVVVEAGFTCPPTCGVPGSVECKGPCYADCDESETLDFFDFLCFQNLFAAGDARADCDEDGELTFFDFLCFQNEFAAGCS